MQPWDAIKSVLLTQGGIDELPGWSVSVDQSSASASTAGRIARSAPGACSGWPNTALKIKSCGFGTIRDPP